MVAQQIGTQALDPMCRWWGHDLLFRARSLAFGPPPAAPELFVAIRGFINHIGNLRDPIPSIKPGLTESPRGSTLSPMARRPQYEIDHGPEAYREAAGIGIAHLAAGGTQMKAAEVSGIPRTTLRALYMRLRDNNDTKKALEQAETEIVEHAVVAQHAAIERIRDAIVNGDLKPSQLAVTFGILSDKVLAIKRRHDDKEGSGRGADRLSRALSELTASGASLTVKVEPPDRTIDVTPEKD